MDSFDNKLNNYFQFLDSYSKLSNEKRTTLNIILNQYLFYSFEYTYPNGSVFQINLFDFNYSEGKPYIENLISIVHRIPNDVLLSDFIPIMCNYRTTDYGFVAWNKES